MPEEKKGTDINYIRMSEIEKSHSKARCWVLIHNKVYDVTQFILTHPGGEEVLKEQGGKNASRRFDEVGHSTDAVELMEQFYIGDLALEDRKEKDVYIKPKYDEMPPQDAGMPWTQMIVLAIIIGAVFYYMNS